MKSGQSCTDFDMMVGASLMVQSERNKSEGNAETFPRLPELTKTGRKAAESRMGSD